MLTGTTIRRKLKTAQQLRKERGLGGLAKYGLDKFSHPALEARIRYVDAERGRRFPTSVQIEVSSNCNLRCPSCSLSYEQNAGRHMSVAEFTSVLDRLPFKPGAISLNGIGEPLINPHFLELVDILAQRGIECTFFTNGTLLAPRFRDSILQRMNVTFIGISCDGARKETFEALRFGSKFESWKGFVKEFLAGAHGRAGRPIQTMMSTVLSRRNLREVHEIIALAGELGFRSIHLADMMPNGEVPASLALRDEDRSGLDLGSLQRQGQQLGVDVTASLVRHEKPPKARFNCFQPWEYMMVSAEGDILPCCVIVGSDKSSTMGNIFRQSFTEIWDGKEFRSFRKTTADGTNPLCSICPFY